MRDAIKNWILLAVCFLYVPIRGFAKAVNCPAGRVLLMQDAKMGDMVCATPLVQGVKKKYPDNHIFVFGGKIGGMIIANDPAVDGYIESGDNIIRLIRTIRRQRFDFAAVLVPDFRSAAIAFLAGVKAIACPRIEGGFCPWETIHYRLLRLLMIILPHRMGSYAPREYLRLLEPIGIFTDDTRKRLYYSPAAMEKVMHFYRDHGLSPTKDFIIAISPSAGNKIKEWPAERFAEVAKHAVLHHGAKVIVIGGVRDAQEVGAMMGAMDEDVSILNTLNKFSVDELKAFLSTVHLLIAVDTGPIYIAEAFGVPTIDIVGPVDEKEQPPISDIHKVVFLRDRQKPAMYVMNARVYDRIEVRRQTEAITVAMVTSQLDALAIKIHETRI